MRGAKVTAGTGAQPARTPPPEVHPDFSRIPMELRCLPQWVCWRREQRDGKATKVPYSPKSRVLASVSDPTTWSDFEMACTAARKHKYDGIGFVLTTYDDFTGLDLDKC